MFYAIVFWFSLLFFLIFGGYGYFRPTTSGRTWGASLIFLVIMLVLVGLKLFGEGLKG